jgi:hypothetical protein
MFWTPPKKISRYGLVCSNCLFGYVRISNNTKKIYNNIIKRFYLVYFINRGI